MHEPRDLSRRRFLRDGAGLVVGASLFAPFGRLLAGTPAAPRFTSRAGVLSPTVDASTGLELLALPEGFSYFSFGWTGDAMDDGIATPGGHDGMALVASEGGVHTLVRNHEIWVDSGSFGPPELTYDPEGGGGCTVMRVDPVAGELLSSRTALAGTLANCAGGGTPWGSWLSCEELPFEGGDSIRTAHGERAARLQRSHGWVFDVPPEGSDARPIEGMGRFSHEAAAVDSARAAIYLTEDARRCGFYRFLPDDMRDLHAGGRLQMLRARGETAFAGSFIEGTRWDVDWVDIETPGQVHAPGEHDFAGVLTQGAVQGGAVFTGLEGLAIDGDEVWFTSKRGGAARRGQLWRYWPESSELELVVESRGKDHLDAPDNICITPGGGLMVCEDGAGAQYLLGLSRDGQLFRLARNAIRLRGERNGHSGDFRSMEWCGACFSPDGRWLFVNVQTPGISFAITGPWDALGL